MPYTVVKDFQFAAAHRIPGHRGECRNLHGHNYRVRVHLQASELDALGMVMDFAEVKGLLRETAGAFDHRVLNEIPPFDRTAPSAENLSEHLFRGLEARLAAEGRVRLRRVEVWENEASCAIFEP